MQPVTTSREPIARASSMARIASIDSLRASSMNAHVFTTTTSASAGAGAPTRPAPGAPPGGLSLSPRVFGDPRGSTRAERFAAGHDAGLAERPCPHAASVRLGGVQAVAGRGQADAVGRVEREDHFSDRRAVRLAVVDAGAVAAAVVANAMVGEPHSARGVEHEVVGRAQELAVAFRVQVFDLATREIDALDRPVTRV